MIYSGDRFPDWRGDALIGGLSSKALIRVAIDGDASAREVARYDMGERIRGVVQGPEGGVWLLEDGDKGSPAAAPSSRLRRRGAACDASLPRDAP